jgi:hypothetical protein
MRKGEAEKGQNNEKEKGQKENNEKGHRTLEMEKENEQV